MEFYENPAATKRLTGFLWNSGTEFYENPANRLVADNTHVRTGW